MTKLPVILAITGASGAPYGVRLLEMLAVHHVPTWLLVSSHGWRLLTEECGITDDRALKQATGGEWTRSQVGTWCTASISSSRTPYGAPEAPVMAKITGNRFNAPSDSESDCAWGERAGGAAPANAECGMRNAEFQGEVGARPHASAASLIDLA